MVRAGAAPGTPPPPWRSGKAFDDHNSPPVPHPAPAAPAAFAVVAELIFGATAPAGTSGLYCHHCQLSTPVCPAGFVPPTPGLGVACLGPFQVWAAGAQVPAAALGPGPGAGTVSALAASNQDGGRQ